MNYRSFQKARNGFIAPVSYRANPIPCGGLSPFAKTSELAKKFRNKRSRAVFGV